MTSRIFFGKPPAARDAGREGGFALILTLMVLMLLIAIIKPLIFEVQRESQVTTFDRADMHLRLAAQEAFREALDVLEQDFPQESSGMGMPGAGAEGTNALSGLGEGGSIQGMGTAGTGAAGAGGEQQPEEEAPHDSFNSDSMRYHRKELDRERVDDRVPNWAIAESPNSQGYERDNVRVTSYIYIEDENRKFNLLELASPNEEIQQRVTEQLERLLEWVREDRSQAGMNAEMDIRPFIEAVRDWISMKIPEYRVLDGDVYVRPELLSNESEEEARTRDRATPDKTTLPLTLLELRQALADRVTMPEDIWIDRLDTEKILRPGLESLLTVFTTLTEDPIREDEYGVWIPDEEASGQNRTSAASPLRRSQPQTPTTPAPEAAEDTMGLVNINTAPWAVLRALAPPDEIPDSVIDAIIEWRNEVDEEKLERIREQELQESQFAESQSQTDVLTGMEGDEYEPRQAFTTLQDLEKIEDFKVLDDQYKASFAQYLTVTSDVFSIWVTVVCRPNESGDEAAAQALFGPGQDEIPIEERWLDIKPGEIVRRYRKVVWRRAGTEGLSPVEFISIIPWESRIDRKFALQEDPDKIGF